MKKNRCYILLLLIGLLWSACSEKDDFKVSDSRTVLVYMGMNDGKALSNIAPKMLEVLRKNWDASYDGNLIAYVDSGQESYLVHIHAAKGGNIADTVINYGRENSADPAVLERVLSDVRKKWPAQHYGLVVSSHGSGWLPAGELTNPNSVPMDNSYAVAPNFIIEELGDEMDIADFVGAIPFELEYIIFDACLMGSVEVAYELRNKTDYIVASPAEVLINGFVYSTMMEHLMKQTPDLNAVARDFFDHYNALSDFDRSATVAVIKTDELEALTDISKGLLGGVNIEDAVKISDIQTFGYGYHRLYFDFGHLIKKLNPERYEEFQAQLDRVLTYKAHTPAYSSSGRGICPISEYSGLTLYIPQKNYPYINSEYKKMSWVQRINSGSEPV